jgi:hypothetical protein
MAGGNYLVNSRISRRSCLIVAGGAASTAVFGSASVSKVSTTGVTIGLAGESDVGEGGRWMRARAQECTYWKQLFLRSAPTDKTELDRVVVQTLRVYCTTRGQCLGK